MNILIKLVNNQPITSSLVISEQFERRHDNVVVSIKKLINSNAIGSLDFKETYYIDKSNRKQKMYELTERGFLIAMPFIGGSKAEQGQIKLVDAFLETHQRSSLPQNFAQALRLSAELEEQKQIADEIRIKIQKENDFLRNERVRLKNEILVEKKNNQQNINQKKEIKFLEMNLVYGHKCRKSAFNKLYKVGTAKYRECVLNKGRKK